jgi:hypothetical protein
VTDTLLAVVAVAAVASLSGLGALAAWRSVGPDRAKSDPTPPIRFAVVAYLGLYVAGSLLIIVAGESRGAGPLLGAGAVASLGAGALAGRRLWGTTPPMGPPRGDGVSVAGVVLLAVVGLGCVGYLIALNGLPLLDADPQGSRAGFSGLVFDTFRWLVPPAALLALAYAVANAARRPIWLATAGVAAVAGLEVLLASRALPFELVIGAVLIVWWAGRRPRPGAWLGLAALGVVVFVGVQLVRVGPEGGFSGAADAASFAVRRTIDRVALIHPRTLEVVATRIPAEEPYFGGSTYVRRVTVALGGAGRPTLGYWIYERLFPSQPGGFAAPGIAGEAWANGGPLLVVALMAALGAVAVWFGQFVARLPGGPADRVLAALLVMATARTYATSLNGFLVTVAVAFGWWLVASGRIGRQLDRILRRRVAVPAD